MGWLWKHGFGHIFAPFHNLLCVVTFPHYLLYHKNIISFPWDASQYPFLTHDLHAFHTSDENHWRPDDCRVQTTCTHHVSRHLKPTRPGTKTLPSADFMYAPHLSQLQKRCNQGTLWNVTCRHHKFIYICSTLTTFLQGFTCLVLPLESQIHAVTITMHCLAS
jgi:hypothetical protein